MKPLLLGSALVGSQILGNSILDLCGIYLWEFSNITVYCIWIYIWDFSNITVSYMDLYMDLYIGFPFFYGILIIFYIMIAFQLFQRPFLGIGELTGSSFKYHLASPLEIWKSGSVYVKSLFLPGRKCFTQ